MKIAILKLGAIGDTILTTPFVRQLRKNNPDARIDYWIGKYSSNALYKNERIDNIIAFDESIFTDRKIIGWFRLISKIRKNDYSMIFMMDKHWIFSLTAYLTGIKNRIGFNRGKEGLLLTKKVSYGKLRHEIYYYLDLLKISGYKTDYADASLELCFERRKKKNIIGMIPDGGNNFNEKTMIRLWSVENYSKLAARLDYPIYIFGTDKKMAGQILKLSQNKDIKSLVGESIAESASYMSECACIITNDCGGMHIASCTNTRIIGLFGPTHPKRKAPFGSIHIWKGKKYYDPDYELYGKMPKECNTMALIKVDEVLDAVMNVMNHGIRILGRHNQ